MNAKTITLIAIFGCLAVILNPSISGIGMPFPLFPIIILQIWEIPIMVAFLLFGLKVGFSVAIINATFLLVGYPGPVNPWYGPFGLVSVSSMMLGVFLSRKILYRNCTENRARTKAKILVSSLAFGMLFRVSFMTCMWAGLLSLTYTTFTVPMILFAMFPGILLGNVVLSSYMIPAGYFVAEFVSKNLKIGNRII